MKRFTPILALVAVCWAVFLVNHVMLRGALTTHGVVPRHLASLPGILWSPFLHVSLAHLMANTLPLLILGGIICARSKAQFIGVTMTGILLGGLLVWLFARNADHVGASGLVFCYFGFTVARAWFDRTILDFGLALICMVGYGGILFGLLPVVPGVSWEAHLAGLLAGVVSARVISNAGRKETPGALPGFKKAG
jgi:membrane associated rhomboid family serine protease